MENLLFLLFFQQSRSYLSWIIWRLLAAVTLRLVQWGWSRLCVTGVWVKGNVGLWEPGRVWQVFGSKGMLVSENQVMCDRCLGQRECWFVRTRSCMTSVWVKGNVGLWEPGRVWHCLGQRECWCLRTRSCVTGVWVKGNFDVWEPGRVWQVFGLKGMLVSENQVVCDGCLGQRECWCLRTRSCVTGVWVKGNVGVW